MSRPEGRPTYWKLVQEMTGMDKTYDCLFRGLGNQKTEFSFGFDIPMKALSLTEAYRLLAGTKLRVTLCCDPNSDGDTDGQGTLAKAAAENEIELKLDAESTRFAVVPGSIAGTIKVHKDEVEFDELDKFSYHKGTVQIEKVGKAEVKRRTKDESDDPEA